MGLQDLGKVLVANRGEIACRVIRTARRLGLRSVAVYSEPDAASQHVALADEAVCVGPAPSGQSYLKIDAILDAARRTGAQAVHPGYGFLSENAQFADAVVGAGLTFIGPPASAMRAMGSKDAAKRLMEAAGVPLLPGYHGEDQSAERLRDESAACGLAEGLPVLLKAVLGGGGKGMRIVRSMDELQEGIDGAMREAVSSFGDGRLIVERYLPRARHIEVQVFADTHGGAVHLFERDCSVQRRHQKVIEEAPAPGVDAALREELGAAAVRAARAVDYEGAGTVEFIADAADPSRFYFMEMNTRLQVEHPVTEMVTGVDLVEWQLRVAAGEALPLAQHELSLAGHAFEARIYAEHPEKGFLPGSGVISHLRTPADEGDTYIDAAARGGAGTSGAVRVDLGIAEGDEVSVHYDPMLAKLITRGANRGDALRRMASALAEWQTAGLPTNVPFLHRLATHASFAAADVHTAFIDEHTPALLPSPPPPPAALAAAASLVHLRGAADALAAAQPAHSPFADFAFARLGGGVCGGSGATALELTPLESDGGEAGAPFAVRVRRPSGAARATAEPWAFEVAVEPAAAAGAAAAGAAAGGGEYVSAVLGGWDTAARTFDARVDGAAVAGSALVEVAAAADGEAGATVVTVWSQGGEALSVAVRDAAQQAQQRSAAAAAEAGGGATQQAVRSPMPGKLVKVLVAAGQPVKAGEALVVLEAMKMEHTMYAAADATVKGVHASEGAVVPQREMLVSFE